MQYSKAALTDLMQEALKEAQTAGRKGEVPVGAVIVIGEKIISRAHNLVESLKDVSAHAEMLAIRQASQSIGNWRLSEAVLCVTLEPCPMCIGAIRLARIPTIVFGAHDPRLGAVGSLFDLGSDSRLGSVPRIIQGIEEKACSEILTNFFTSKRA